MDIIGTRLKNDLLVWAEKAGAQFHRAGNTWRSSCPLHGGDNPNGFAVYSEGGKQKFKCFTGPCGQGDIYDFVMRWQNCEFPDAYRILGGENNPDPAEIARAAEEQAARAAAELQAQIEKAQRTLHELQHAQAWLTYHRNLLESPDARLLWRQRGLPDDWQDFWELGYCQSFAVGTDAGRWNTPTLTIPVKDENWEVTNIRHRLLNPPTPNDKYRPDRPGLQATPFVAHPGLSYNIDPILIVEGEIKSMVTYKTIYTGEQTTAQVIGIPGKTAFRTLVDKLRGHTVYVCLDPDADQEASELAGLVNGRVVTIPMKIDDAILAGCLDRRSIEMRMKAARRA